MRLLVRVLLSLLLLGGALAWAQRSGGGVGGRGGFSAPRSSPSIPRVNPSPAPSFPLPTPSYPAPRPSVYVVPGPGGSAGFDLLALLLIGGIVLVGFAMVRGLRQAGSLPEEATVGRLRLAMLHSPRLQRSLRRLAEGADTESSRGLADLIDNAVVLLLREAAGWRYGQYEVWRGGLEQAEGRFDAWMSETRGEFVETYRHFEGRVEREPDYVPQSEPGGRYLVVTLILAVRGALPPVALPLRREGARAALLAFATSSPTTLLAAYVAWTPEAEGEALSEEELLRGWPQLELL
ncbi:DUF1517 domain-containing protein [Meiothermus sp. QL-1]|uniref:DUF1517 domain-containing protein n=1 Tax=Meiothermus sp. QL-1 TaxID=2058095 RepID=UPI003518C958